MHQIIEVYGVMEKEKGERVARSTCSRCAQAIWTAIEENLRLPTGRPPSVFITGFCDTLKTPVWDDDEKVHKVVLDCSAFIPNGTQEAPPIEAKAGVSSELAGLPDFQ